MKLRMVGCCDCTGSACGMECRGKTGTVAHCGFVRFGTVGARRYYRRRTVTGTASVCVIPFPDCTQPTCAKGATLGFGGEIPGYNGTFVAQGALSPMSGTNYVASCGAVHTDTEGHSTVIGARLIVNIAGEQFLYDGTVRSLTGGMGSVALQLNYVAWTSVDAKCINTEVVGSSMTGDVWDLTQEYDAATCELTEVDNSWRGTGGTECQNPTTPEGPIPCDPLGCYGTPDTQTETLRRWLIASCGNTSGGSIAVRRDVFEQLTDEDTIADAVERTEGGLEWVGGTCADNIAFATVPDDDGVFAFRQAQVRSVCGTIEEPLVVGHNYSARVSFWRRAVASGGTWLYYGAAIVGFTATATIETTPWVDIPNEEGFETKTGSCSVVDNSL